LGRNLDPFGVIRLRSRPGFPRINCIRCTWFDWWFARIAARLAFAIIWQTDVLGIFGKFNSFFALPMNLKVAMAGAKLITPFGLLGRWCSIDFQERLRTYYHTTQPRTGNEQNDSMDVVRVFAFLRDYVIDFGPADFKPEPAQSGTPSPVDIEGNTLEDRLRHRSRQSTANSDT
jgi:hypothetical protein